MKGCAIPFVAVLLILCVYNWWQIQTLRQEIARLERKIEHQQQTSVADQMVAEAVRALGQAREAIAKTDTSRVRALLEEARCQLESAARAVSEKSRPTVEWLEAQATDLNRRIQGGGRNDVSKNGP